MITASTCGAAIYGWVLALMISLQPSAPWKDSYEHTACVLATMATTQPLKVEKAVARTAVLLVSVAWFESRFNPDAHNPLDPGGGSFGLFQASRVPVESVEADTQNALGMIRQSFRVCAGLSGENALGWFCAGGPKCISTKESKHRIGLASRLLREHPAP